MIAHDWTQLEEFDAVDLSGSYVLGWHQTPTEVIFELDVALTPEHRLYAPPPADERECWVRGALHFPQASVVHGLQEQRSVRGATDATGARDYGSIEHLSWADGHAHIVGEFGDVSLGCSRPYLTFSGDAPRSV